MILVPGAHLAHNILIFQAQLVEPICLCDLAEIKLSSQWGVDYNYH